MAIAEPTQGEGIAFAKFNQIGDTLIGAYGGCLQRQKVNFKTRELEWKDAAKTKAKLEEVLYLVAMPGSTATIGEAQPIAAGTHVRWGADGYKWGQIIEATKALPAVGDMLKAGQRASSDVWTICLTGFSSETDNADAARKAGFTVVEGRIILRNAAEHEQWVLARVRSNQNTNAAKDYEITARRITAAETEWERQADALFTSKPWERQLAPVGGGASTEVGLHDDEAGEPF